MSANQIVLVGTGGTTAEDIDPVVLQLGNGADDDGTSFNGTGRSNRVAPAGIGGECSFYALHVAVIFEGAALALTIGATIDELVQPSRSVVLTNPNMDGSRCRLVAEVPLKVQLPDTITNFASKGVWAPRGTWIQVDIATDFTDEDTIAYVQLDGVELEYEIVREGRQAP